MGLLCRACVACREVKRRQHTRIAQRGIVVGNLLLVAYNKQVVVVLQTCLKALLEREHLLCVGTYHAQKQGYNRKNISHSQKFLFVSFSLLATIC